MSDLTTLRDQRGMWRVDSHDGETTWHTTHMDALAEEQRRIDEVLAKRTEMTRHLPVRGIVVWFDVQGAVACSPAAVAHRPATTRACATR